MADDMKDLARQIGRFAEVTALTAVLGPNALRCSCGAYATTASPYAIKCDSCRDESKRACPEGDCSDCRKLADIPTARHVRRLLALLRDEGPTHTVSRKMY